MVISKKGLELIKEFEGLRLKAYLDSAGVPTIGFGTIRYPDGTKVKMGDVCTEKQADEWLLYEVTEKTRSINTLVKMSINQNQFDALCSFAYNVGTGALGKSTLLKRVNINPFDQLIRSEFLKWNRAGGAVVKGLTIRRTKEASLYFA